MSRDNGTSPQGSEGSPEPSHIMTGTYAVLQEMNERKCQSMLYFIRTEGNMEELQYLQDQLEPIDWELMENCGTFDLDLENLVSAQTAKEMSKVDLNPIFHRKFDGKLERVDFGFRRKEKNIRKIEKVYDLIGDGGIDEFIDDEDIDPGDLEDNPSSSEYETSDDDDFSESEEEEDRRRGNNRTARLPPSLLQGEKPRFANKAQRHRKP